MARVTRRRPEWLPRLAGSWLALLRLRIVHDRGNRYHPPLAISLGHHIRIHIVVLAGRNPVADTLPGGQVSIARAGVVEALGHVYSADGGRIGEGAQVREDDGPGERFRGHAGLAEIGFECAQHRPGRVARPAVVLISAVLGVEESEQEVLGRDDRGHLAGVGGQPARHDDMDVAAEWRPVQWSSSTMRWASQVPGAPGRARAL